MKYFLELHPRKRSLPKKLTYVTDEWIALVKLTEEHIQKLKDEKEQRRLDKIAKREILANK